MQNSIRWRIGMHENSKTERNNVSIAILDFGNTIFRQFVFNWLISIQVTYIVIIICVIVMTVICSLEWRFACGSRICRLFFFLVHWYGIRQIYDSFMTAPNHSRLTIHTYTGLQTYTILIQIVHTQTQPYRVFYTIFLVCYFLRSSDRRR